MSPKTTPMAPRTSAAVPARFTERKILFRPTVLASSDVRATLRLGETPADRIAHELHAIAHAELAQQVGPVRLDGLLGQVQRLGDLLVRVGLGDQLEHLLLARGERLFRARRG